MRSSSGQHFIALDHIRALATFLVVAWHFLHYNNGTPVPFEGAPSIFPLALIDEGHTGVALFMVLSGYLFAKLLDGKEISYPAFFWNRFIRLAPLLLFTALLVGIERYLSGENLAGYFVSLYRGFIYPVWPNGGWSITTEIHFYIALPLLLWLSRRSKLLPISIILAAIVFRAFYFRSTGEVQSLAYWTILGRIDQFILGIVAFGFSAQIGKRSGIVLSIGIVFTTFWWWFDITGGFYLRPAYPSSSSIWIWIPTIEGAAYATLIAWYDTRKIKTDTPVSRILQRLGEYSYSIYLLHVFIVFKVAKYIHEHIMDISNFYVALVWAAIFFMAMLMPGYLSFRFIEEPFLRLRLRYTKQSEKRHFLAADGDA